jgi:hypothetical protein
LRLAGRIEIPRESFASQRTKGDGNDRGAFELANGDEVALDGRRGSAPPTVFDSVEPRNVQTRGDAPFGFPSKRIRAIDDFRKTELQQGADGRTENERAKS